jgi:hypothetical protein
MPWQTIVHTDLPIIETTYSGRLTKNDLSDAVRENLSLAHTHNRTRFLGDCTNLNGGHTIIDLYFLAKEVSREVSLNFGPYLLKEAILIPSIPSMIEKINFWETIGQNGGFRVRVFRERQSAIDWLLE